jgi:hypothetical protein
MKASRLRASRRWRFFAATIAGSFATACGGGDSTSPGVVNTPVSVVTFSSAPLQLMVAGGGTQQLAVQARDASGNVLTGRTITWSSSDGAVASVSSKGLVTPLAPGYTTISASSEGRLASFTLQVVQAISNVSVTYPEDIFEIGTTHQLAVSVRDASGANVVNPSLTWTLPNTNVATVSNSGVLSIISTDNDSIVVTAEIGGKTGRFRFFAWPSLASGSSSTIAGAFEQSRWFLFRVTPGTTKLTVTLDGGSGDPDLFLWTPGTWSSAVQTCESIATSSTESCTIDAPIPGLWSVEVYGYSAYSGVSLRAVRE